MHCSITYIPLAIFAILFINTTRFLVTAHRNDSATSSTMLEIKQHTFTSMLVANNSCVMRLKA